MQHLRRPRLAGLAGVLAGSVLLVAGCSDQAPAPAPGPGAPSAPSSSSVATPSASPSASPTAAPSGTASTGGGPASTPAPSGDGSVEPSRPVETAAPKKLDEPTRTAGAEVSLVSVRATTVKAATPGDSSGPGVLVRLKLVNTTGKTLDTGFVQVNVANAAGAPGTAVTGAPTRALGGSLKKGASAQGTYAFLLDDATRGDVTVSVYVTSGQPVVQFRGRVR